ncbi:MAG: proton-conducting transporter membrane subunit [Candidatus Dormibacteria bacterium]
MSHGDHLTAGLLAVLPAAVLLVTGLATVLLDRGRPAAPGLLRAVAASGLVLALLAQLAGLLPLQPSRAAFLAAQGDATIDRFGILAGAMVLVLGLGGVLAVPWALGRLRPHLGTYCAALLGLSAGADIVCNSGSLPGLYGGAELAGISGVLMIAVDKRAAGSNRGALRLLISGGVGSGVALYGMALLVGLSGHLRLTDLAATLPGGALAATAVTLVLAGLLFKLAVAPLLLDTDDPRGGVATGTLAPLVAVSIVAGYAGVARLVAVLPAGTRVPVEGILAVLAAGALLGGGLRALQAGTVAGLARALAGSGVGLLLVALVGTRATSGGITAGLLQAAALGGGLLAMGALGAPVEGAGHSHRLRGLGHRHPRGALTVACGVVILAGVPPLLGALARAAVMESALLSGFGWLAVVTAVAWLLSLIACARALSAVYAGGAEVDAQLRDRRPQAGGRWALGFAGVLLAAPLFLQQLTGIAGRAASAVLR